ncbi:MAG: permease [Candidatus Zixiibacteriota bacterium]
MLKIIPAAFILIGLFDIWVKREHVERHVGSETSVMSLIWAILLASTTVGGLYVAIPLAFTLHSKGAASSFIYTYLGAAAICRIPMTLFEASFIGIKFTAIRFGVSLPLVIISSVLLGRYLPISSEKSSIEQN